MLNLTLEVDNKTGVKNTPDYCQRKRMLAAFLLYSLSFSYPALLLFWQDLWLQGQSLATAVNCTRAQHFSQASVWLLEEGKSSFLESMNEPAPFPSWYAIWNVTLLQTAGHHLPPSGQFCTGWLTYKARWMTTGINQENFIPAPQARWKPTAQRLS